MKEVLADGPALAVDASLVHGDDHNQVLSWGLLACAYPGHAQNALLPVTLGFYPEEGDSVQFC